MWCIVSCMGVCLVIVRRLSSGLNDTIWFREWHGMEWYVVKMFSRLCASKMIKTTNGRYHLIQSSSLLLSRSITNWCQFFLDALLYFITVLIIYYVWSYLYHHQNHTTSTRIKSPSSPVELDSLTDSSIQKLSNCRQSFVFKLMNGIKWDLWS